jgi:putative exosortase-associated protein (TIGR04073 family)
MKHYGLLKVALFAAVIGIALSLADSAEAYKQNPRRKFARGVHNVMYGWTEIPTTVHNVDREYGPAAATSFGLVKGITNAVGRTVVGAYEMLTFPIKNGRRGYDPIIEPEFMLRSWHDDIVPIWNSDK